MLAILRRRGIPCRAGAKPGEIWAKCPWCGDYKYRLGINPSKNVLHCFNCKKRSRNAAKLLEFDAPSGPVDPEPEAPPPPPSLPEDYQPLADAADGHWTRQAWRYLHGRGIPDWQVRMHGIGLSLAGRAHHRIVFPVWEGRELRGWSARTITEATPKYLHSIGLASPYVARPPDKQRVAVITEGILDALSVARATGYRAGSVALLGTSLPLSRYRPLRECSAAVLWLDPDSAGREAIGRIGAELADRGHRVLRVDGIRGTDPGDMPAEDLRRALKHNLVPWRAADANLWIGGD